MQKLTTPKILQQALGCQLLTGRYPGKTRCCSCEAAKECEVTEFLGVLEEHPSIMKRSDENLDEHLALKKAKSVAQINFDIRKNIR